MVPIRFPSVESKRVNLFIASRGVNRKIKRAIRTFPPARGLRLPTLNLPVTAFDKPPER
jgi:hypothetical protein